MANGSAGVRPHDHPQPGLNHRNADFFSRVHEHVRCDEETEKTDLEPGEGLLQTETHQEEASICAICRGSEATGCVSKGDLSPAGKRSGPIEEAPDEETKRPPEGAIEGRGRETLRRAQRQDEDCQHLLECLQSDKPEKTWHRDHAFRLAPDGVLEEVTCDVTGEVVYKVVLPRDLIKGAVQDAHAGHLKTKKTLDKLRTSYFFKHMYATCHRYIQGCSICQAKDRGRKYQAPMGSMPEALGAWHTVAVDVLGPLPQTRSGKKYICSRANRLSD